MELLDKVGKAKAVGESYEIWWWLSVWMALKGNKTNLWKTVLSLTINYDS